MAGGRCRRSEVTSTAAWVRRHWFAFCGIISALALCGCTPVRGAAEKVSENALSVMTYNIWDLNGKRPAVEDVAEVIRSEGVPDLVLLQEVRGENMAVFLTKALELPYHLYFGFDGANFGVAILSRYPLTKCGFLHFKASRKGHGALRANVTVNGRTVRICSVHLDRIDAIAVKDDGVQISWGEALSLLTSEMTEETVRSRSVDELLEWIGSGGAESVIIGGDFNTVLYSMAIRRMAAVFDDALWDSQDYFTGTYLKSTLPVNPRLDFLFHSSDMVCHGAYVVKKSAGDHYPVRAVFVNSDG